MAHYTYTRTSGRQHTYDIECTANSFEISLNGKVLLPRRPIISTGNITGEQEMLIHAKSAIEHLSHMDEE